MLEPSPDDGKTALHWLMRSIPGSLDLQKRILKLFFTTSGELSPRDYDGWTPLHITVFENSVELAELLIQNGANPHAQDHSGKTPLQLANDLDRTEIVAAIEIALVKHTGDRPQIVIDPMNHESQSHESMSPISLQSPDIHVQVSSTNGELLRDEIVDWLDGYAYLEAPNVSSTLLNTGEHQRLLGCTNYTSWCTGSSPRRIVCCGLHHTRLVSCDSVNVKRCGGD
ncbi:unnamed protein product [Aureobasidium vineae]|uniref:Ankyrin n=1 Tax=Aureobasidium vineae TaxID=2773715 RepID=A0A9N8K236_9PEZI|nr:unnamed protein product [Aureobasidium vineae]